MTAAAAARERHGEVIVLERDANPHGSTGMSYGGICAAGTKLQREAGIDDSPELLRDDILSITKGATDSAFAEVLAREAAVTLDWLTEDLGVELTIETSWTGLGHQHPRLHAPKDRSGESLLAMLLRATERAGADLLTAAHVDALFVEDSRVTGVRIARPNGQTETLACDALILASSGFGANSALIRKHIPDLADARYYGHEGNQGEGILWGLELGAAVADMGSYQALGSLAIPQAMVMPHTLLIGGGIQVNLDGKRFENELDDISGQALNILAQPNGVCWMVFDQRLHEHARATFREYREADELGTAKRGENCEELAAVTGLPPQALAKTIADVSELSTAGADDAFGRTFEPQNALTPPYYAIRVTGALFHTQGGLVVDSQARVVRPDGGILPNLYAGGGAARSVSGPSGWGYLPGMGLCTAVTLGRLAGQSATQRLEVT